MQRLLALLVAATMALAGCSGEESPPTCEGPDCKETATVTESNTVTESSTVTKSDTVTNTDTSTVTDTTTVTAQPETNELPVLVMVITDDEGNVSDVVWKGRNLTFDASGSFDPDGSIQEVGIVVTDANGTRPAEPLVRNGKSTPKKIAFHHTGVATLEVNVLDDRTGIVRSIVEVYVNTVQKPPSFSFKGPNPTGDATTCAGTAGDPIIDSQYYREFKFEAKPGAKWIEADLVQGDGAQIAICAPDGTALSGADAAHVESDGNGTLLAGLDYYVAAYQVGAPAGGSAETAVEVVVHYEPKA